MTAVHLTYNATTLFNGHEVVQSTACGVLNIRGGYRISGKGGLLMNNKTGGGGGEGAVRFGRFYERGGGGGRGGVLSACVQKTRFLDKRGGCKPQNPLKLRAKKRNLDK